MKITIFSSNQPRHLHLVKKLSLICEEVFFISEVKTIFTGIIQDKISKSDVMEAYFSNVSKSEKNIFGEINFLPPNVKVLSIKSGDLSLLNKIQLNQALHSDLYVVFGASYIKGWLIDFLLMKKAINIHMGLSPYYRGAACNFWALYDNNPNYVGATIHLLSKGLDSGDMLCHCVPKPKKTNNIFDFTMRSVLVAHEGLADLIRDKSIQNIKPIKQDKTYEIRYSRHQDFNDEIATEFLQRNMKINFGALSYPELLNPIIK
ncbi:formyltransferase family protein [SAR86 cluster bacterium]|nr:formyltransferase family protein [SAR86 cluster bacterium]